MGRKKGRQQGDKQWKRRRQDKLARMMLREDLCMWQQSGEKESGMVMGGL